MELVGDDHSQNDMLTGWNPTLEISCQDVNFYKSLDMQIKSKLA
jgi:hypothetical protein